jgi:hypothetical protein
LLTLSALLLLAQAAGLAVFAAYRLSALWFVFLFSLPIALAITASLSVFFWPGGGWLLAMLSQCFTLGSALAYYFYSPPTFKLSYTYAIMLGGIGLVLYFNSAKIRWLLQKESPPNDSPS